MSIPVVNITAGISGAMQGVNSCSPGLKSSSRSMAGSKISLPARLSASSVEANRGRSISRSLNRNSVCAMAGDAEGMGWVETSNGARVKYRNAMSPRSPSPPPAPSAGSSERASKWGASSSSKWQQTASKWDTASLDSGEANQTPAASAGSSPAPTDPRYNGGVTQAFHSQVAHVAASHAHPSQEAYQAASYAQATQAAVSGDAMASQAAQVSASHASNIVPTAAAPGAAPGAPPAAASHTSARAAAIALASGGAVESVPAVVPSGAEGASTKVNQDVLESAMRDNPAIRRIMDIETAAVKAKSYIVAERAEKAVARLAEISQELRAARAREVEAGAERDYATAMTSKNLVDILEKESTELAAHDYWGGDLVGFPFSKKAAKDAVGVPVRFRIPMQVDFGYSLFVVGSGDELGNWEADNAVPMQWTQEGWQAEMMLPMGQRVEFKFLQREQVEQEDGKMGWGEAIWQEDPNRVVTLPFGGVKTVDVQSSWEVDAEAEQVWTCTSLENTGKTGAMAGNKNGE